MPPVSERGNHEPMRPARLINISPLGKGCLPKGTIAPQNDFREVALGFTGFTSLGKVLEQSKRRTGARNSLDALGDFLPSLRRDSSLNCDRRTAALLDCAGEARVAPYNPLPPRSACRSKETDGYDHNRCSGSLLSHGNVWTPSYFIDRRNGEAPLQRCEILFLFKRACSS